MSTTARLQVARKSRTWLEQGISVHCHEELHFSAGTSVGALIGATCGPFMLHVVAGARTASARCASQLGVLSTWPRTQFASQASSWDWKEAGNCQKGALCPSSSG